VIHPGRRFAEKLGENPISADAYIDALQTFFVTDKVIKPKMPAIEKNKVQVMEAENSDKISEA
jgi:p-aminobenzoyl-glutamate transporter AbgT